MTETGKPKISLIVAVYNARQYLDSMLESVCNQTLKDIEIILVDDASTDGSDAVLNEWMIRDKRIKYLKHITNKGPCAARYTAFLMATGEYILTVDADDQLLPGVLAHVYEKAIAQNADIVQFRARVQKLNGKSHIMKQVNPLAVKGVLSKNLKSMVLWTRLIRRSLLQQGYERLGFPLDVRINVGEDLLVLTTLFLLADKIIFDKFVGYLYLRRSGSLTKGIHEIPLEKFENISKDLVTVFNLLHKIIEILPESAKNIEAFESIKYYNISATLLKPLKDLPDNSWNQRTAVLRKYHNELYLFDMIRRQYPKRLNSSGFDNLDALMANSEKIRHIAIPPKDGLMKKLFSRFVFFSH